MSLAQRLATPPAPKAAPTVMDRWLATLSEADQEAVLTAVRDPAWRHCDLQPVLIAEGAPEIADTSFGTWRRKKGLAR